MTISGGAQITTASGSIGEAAGADGEAEVTGFGSTWESLGRLGSGPIDVMRSI